MKRLPRSLAATLLAVLSATGALAEPPAPIPLWPEGVPGEADLALPEETREEKNNDGIWRVSNVSQPTITLYPAPADNNTGAAVLVCPGGAHNILAITHEGEQVCEWLNGIGVNAILLKYRVPRREGLDKHHPALQDAQRAMSMVRKNAADWKLDPDRIGILGFSAGGHLSIMTLTTPSDQRTYPLNPEIDSVDCRPNFALPIYPAYLKSESDPNRLAPEIQVTKDTPPVFMVIAHGDKSFVEGNALFYLAMRRAGASAELHIFAKGGHGFGMKKIGEEIEKWPALAENWLRTMGYLGDGAARTASTAPPVAILKGSDYTVTLHAGANGTLFSVFDAAGKPMAREIDLEHLRAEFPKIHAEVKGTWAGNESGRLDFRIDASAPLPARPIGDAP